MEYLLLFATTALIFVVLAFIINKIICALERRNVPFKGKLIEVPGGKTNVNIEGKGRQTIVILSGFGVSYPIAEYAPLSHSLSDRFAVATVDYLGMGFSSSARIPRTNSAIVEDIRAALIGAGLKPPYFFLPHSIGGVYAQYYAITYPNEVAGLILLDTTPTISVDNAMPKMGLWLSCFAQNLGQTRLQIMRMKRHFPYTSENGYTPEDRRALLTFLKRVYNRTMIDQAVRMPAAIAEVESLTMPEGMAVHKIVSKITYEANNPRLGMSSKEFQERHFAQLGNNFSYDIINGPHMLHHQHAKEISSITKRFIDKTVALRK